jgi:hypothetical protein
MSLDGPPGNGAMSGGPAATDATPMKELTVGVVFRLGLACGRCNFYPAGNPGDALFGTFTVG